MAGGAPADTVALAAVVYGPAHDVCVRGRQGRLQSCVCLQLGGAGQSTEVPRAADPVTVLTDVLCVNASQCRRLRIDPAGLRSQRRVSQGMFVTDARRLPDAI